MARVIDLTGQRFGRLIVIGFAGKDKWDGALWECKCVCGNIKTYKSGDLRRKNGSPTQSCGCLKLDNMRKEYGDASLNRLIRQYKTDANKRRYGFYLSKEDVRYITKQPCFYCGNPPSQTIKPTQGHSRSYGEYVYNGIDRIDNEVGYTIDNVVPCCGICNRAKRDLELTEFRNHIQKVYQHWAKSE